MFRRDTFDAYTNLEALIETFVIAVASAHFGNDPQLLRIGRQQWRAHHKWASGQYLFVIGFRCVCQQSVGIDDGGRCDWRSSQTDEYGQYETGEKRHYRHNEFTLVHRVQSHVDGTFATIMMICWRDVSIEFTKYIAKR